MYPGSETLVPGAVKVICNAWKFNVVGVVTDRVVYDDNEYALGRPTARKVAVI
jgi:hypothetical protein